MPEAKPDAVIRPLSLASESILVQAFWIFTFAVLTAIGAQIEIPHQPVPFTFQTFFVLLSGSLLGKRNGFLAMSFYLLMGVAGLPVFSSGGFGLAKLLGPTGGYLLSFPIASIVIAYLLSRRPLAGPFNRPLSYAWTGFSMLIGLLIIFSAGTLQLNFVYFHDWNEAIKAGFLIFSLWDVLKLVVAVIISQEISRRLI